MANAGAFAFASPRYEDIGFKESGRGGPQNPTASPATTTSPGATMSPSPSLSPGSESSAPAKKSVSREATGADTAEATDGESDTE